MATARKQKAISLEVKIKILEEIDKNVKSKTEISKEYDIAASTLSTILKNRQKIISAIENRKFMPQRKRLRTAKHVDLESALIIWFNQARAQNAPVSGLTLMEKADLFALELGLDFKATPGWLERFKSRNGLVLKDIIIESADDPDLTTCRSDMTESAHSMTCRPDMTWEWQNSSLPKLLADFLPQDVFNADETGLYFRCLPDKTFEYKNEKCSGGKKTKERITVMVACNSDGSEKIPMFVIGSSKPRCFKNVKKLPVDYSANKKALMTSSIFEDWLRKLDNKFYAQKRKIALVVDNCPAHPVVRNLKSIELIFLPPNTSVLQPCDQGVIKNLKCHYRKLLLQKYLSYMESKQNFNSLNLLDCLHLLNTAWKSVTPKTIANCFRHCGFVWSILPDIPASNETALELSQKKIVSQLENEISNIFKEVSRAMGLSKDITLDTYLRMDDSIATIPALTDDDIVDIVKFSVEENENNTESDKDAEGEILPIPSATDISGMLKVVRRFLENEVDGDYLYDNINELEQYVEKKIIMSAKQKKIT